MTDCTGTVYCISRLRKPQDGLFTGTVDGYDTSNNTYRITFDRVGLGTHSIPDIEVLSMEEPETLPLSTFTAKARPRPQPHHHHFQQQHHSGPTHPASPYNVSPMKYGSVYSPQLANDPLLSGSTPKGKVGCAGFPICIANTKLLHSVLTYSKTLIYYF